MPVSGTDAAEVLEHFPLLREREARIREQSSSVRSHPV